MSHETSMQAGQIAGPCRHVLLADDDGHLASIFSRL